MLIILLLICEDGLLRVADPSYVEACQQHNISHYYNCDMGTEILNSRTWLACPTYIGIIRVQNTQATISTIRLYKKYKKYLWVYCSLADYHIQLGTCGNWFCRNSLLI